MIKMRGRKFWTWGMLFAAAAIFMSSVVIFNTYIVLAENCKLSEQKLDEFAQINALFYCPGASNDLCSGASYNNQVTWADLNPLMGGGNEATGERFKLIVETYGPFAMELQRYYGIPWEMPFVMMIFESRVGFESDPSGPNMFNKDVDDYNMMGLTHGGTYLGDDHYDDPNHQPKEYTLEGQTNAFSYYRSISEMLLGWALYHVRSGHGEGYDQGLKLLTQNDYDKNLLEALKLLMQHYCTPNSCYYKKLYNVMRGNEEGFDELNEASQTSVRHYTKVLANVIESNGWMNSAELAKAWDIQPGGLATTEMKWGNDGWGDIREEAWEAYGTLGLPADAASKLGSNGTGCGTRLRGSCFQLESEYDGGCTDDNFTFFFQSNGYEATWANEEYAGCKIGTAACGPTSIAMIVTAMNDTLVTPLDVVTKVKEKDGPNSSNWKIQIPDCGGSSSHVLEIVKEYDLSYETLNPLEDSFNIEAINRYLDNGDMVLVGVGGEKLDFYDKDNNFMSEALAAPDLGHYVVVRARTDDGYWSLFDGGGWSGDYRNFREYDPNTVVNAVKVHYNNGRGGAWRVFK